MSSNPFSTEDAPPVQPAPEIAQKNSVVAESTEPVYTFEQLIEMAILQARTEVSAKLLKDVNHLWSKLQTDLNDPEFLEKKFTQILELKLKSAKASNKPK